MLLTLYRKYGRLLAVITLTCSGGQAGADAVFFPPAQARYPAYILELPDSISDVLIADASSATMWRFANAGDEVLQTGRGYMSVGLNGVGKERAWDRKTPLGIYFVTGKLDTSRMHEKYGAAAYPLDYPNAWDRYNSRTGDGIWLHGVDRGDADRPPMDTDGCLALPNEALLKLADLLDPLATPVIVARKIRWASRNALQLRRTEFRAALEAWRKSLQQEDLLTYLSLYHADFRHDGMDKTSWAEYRLQVFEARNLVGITLEDVMLIADPEVQDLYLSRFNQVLETANGPVTSTKRLYWHRASDSQWQILSEDSG